MGVLDFTKIGRIVKARRTVKRSPGEIAQLKRDARAIEVEEEGDFIEEIVLEGGIEPGQVIRLEDIAEFRRMQRPKPLEGAEEGAKVPEGFKPGELVKDEENNLFRVQDDLTLKPEKPSVGPAEGPPTKTK